MAVSSELMTQIQARLEDALETGEGSVTDALFALHEADALPPILFHLFACDCAERAMMREKEAGIPLAPALHAVLDARRRHLLGEISEDVMAAFVVEARDEALAASATQRGHEAAHAAADAGSDLIYAVRAVAWATAAARKHGADEAVAEESQWQVRHLLSLLAQTRD